MINTRRTPSWLVLSLAAVLASPSGSGAELNPCSEDIARYCADLEPGNGALSSCLGEDHVDAITEDCRKHLKRTFLRTQVFDVDDECLDASQRLCFDEVLLGGDFQTCLERRAEALPQACRDAIGL